MAKLTWQYLLGGLFAAAFVGSLLALFFSASDKTQLTTVVIVMVGALLLVGVLPQLTEFKIGPAGIDAKLSRIETKVDKANERIAELFALSMSRDTFGQLKKLNDGWMDHYYLDPELKVGLADELNHLKSLGYIQFDKDENVKGVENLPTGNQSNLSRYISVTHTGKRFIELREQTSEHLGAA
jgi:hypothetical protein